MSLVKEGKWWHRCSDGDFGGKNIFDFYMQMCASEGRFDVIFHRCHILVEAGRG